MDAYTVFVITMVVTSLLGLLLAWFYLKHAWREVKQSHQVIERCINEFDANRALQGKIGAALADRIRILETYRVQHANRLNEQEDILSLLNEEAGRLPINSPSVCQPFKVEIEPHPESELFDSSMSDENLHDIMTAPRDTTVVTSAEEVLHRERVKQEFIRKLRESQGL